MHRDQAFNREPPIASSAEYRQQDTASRTARPFAIALCHRRLPAQANDVHGVTRALLEAGQEVREIEDGPLDLRMGPDAPETAAYWSSRLAS